MIMKKKFSHSNYHKNEVQKIVFRKNVSVSFFVFIYTWKPTIFIKEELKRNLENS